MTKYNTPKTALRTIAGITTLTAASVFFSSATAANLTVTIADVATAEGLTAGQIGVWRTGLV